MAKGKNGKKSEKIIQEYRLYQVEDHNDPKQVLSRLVKAYSSEQAITYYCRIIRGDISLRHKVTVKEVNPDFLGDSVCAMCGYSDAHVVVSCPNCD